MARPVRNYPSELRELATGMFTESCKDYTSDWKTADSTGTVAC
ncbi:hypothetical protein [Rhodococcus sp. H29-C3]|nr:hypothetical protein [Rhodococcus sp. H29-C3]MDJ0363209.1 hypothetical protein [Rhodococcus sp. H29-C3]